MVCPAQLEESERLAALPDCGRVAGFAGLSLEGELCWLLAERVAGLPLRDALAAGRDCSWRAGCGAALTDVLARLLPLHQLCLPAAPAPGHMVVALVHFKAQPDTDP